MPTQVKVEALYFSVAIIPSIKSGKDLAMKVGAIGARTAAAIGHHSAEVSITRDADLKMQTVVINNLNPNLGIEDTITAIREAINRELDNQ